MMRKNIVIVCAVALTTLLGILIDPTPPVVSKETSPEPAGEVVEQKRSNTPKEPKKPAEEPREPQKPTWSASSWVSYCKAIAKEAGISLPDSAIQLISRESHCNPTAQNPYSTAYGIGQFLDSTWGLVGCTKSSDPVYQLKCMKKYVEVVYGSWQNALSHSNQKGWY